MSEVAEPGLLLAGSGDAARPMGENGVWTAKSGQSVPTAVCRMSFIPICQRAAAAAVMGATTV